MIFVNGVKTIQWNKDNLFNKCCWNNWTSTHTHTHKMNLGTNLTVFTKINSKWIIKLNVKCKTTKFLEDNLEENLDDLGYGDNFLDKHQRHDP